MSIRTMEQGKRFQLAAHCDTCNMSHMLPGKKGDKVAADDHDCPICNFQVLKVMRSDSSDFSVCPRCFTAEESSSRKWGLPVQAVPDVSPCAERGCHGTLALKENKTGGWRICCSEQSCDALFWMSKDVHKCEALPQQCTRQGCAFKIFRLSFKSGSQAAQVLGGQVEDCVRCNRATGQALARDGNRKAAGRQGGGARGGGARAQAGGGRGRGQACRGRGRGAPQQSIKSSMASVGRQQGGGRGRLPGAVAHGRQQQLPQPYQQVITSRRPVQAGAPPSKRAALHPSRQGHGHENCNCGQDASLSIIDRGKLQGRQMLRCRQGSCSFHKILPPG